ncbi:ABC transporter permease [Pelosinus baikalensis]|uniref:Iron export ABC transporter permease subunit FetB n=1 Tax=Pelosinus baikalensis TaxID=2892015 RepID=A0ABS8HTV1_9FIRM|nr:iron export ABC transporter permease subunit FetB [Pelosinus baikalensis]MCC5466590.1 iron export ABC transporter permease subunit FetB [Pelosinus baikalensis]
MSNLSLILTFSLVLLSLALSYKEKLGLEKDMLIASTRAVIQLTIIGFILHFVFALDNSLITTIILLIMVYNASTVAAKRGEGIEQATLISFAAILSGLVITLGGLIGFQAIPYEPSQVIPISGMVVGNSMVATSLLFKSLLTNFQNKKEEVEVKLCLGAPPKEASINLIRDSIKTAMLPTFDSMKTLGIVQLPGMMTGLILAGIAPESAIKYQIMVAFMLAGAVSVSSFVASYWAYRSFFNKLAQLKEI